MQQNVCASVRDPPRVWASTTDFFEEKGSGFLNLTPNNRNQSLLWPFCATSPFSRCRRVALCPVECRVFFPGPLATVLRIESTTHLMRRRQRVVRTKGKQIQKKGKKSLAKWMQQNVCASGSVKMFLQKTGRHLWDVHPTRLAAGPRYNDGPQGSWPTLPPRLELI